MAQQPLARRKSGVLIENIKTIVYAMLIAIVIRTVAFEPFNIPSGSMIPTLLVGDYLFVSKYSYGYSRFSLPLSPPLFSGRIFGRMPERGDVAVFKLPRDTSLDYIKRIIGLPGDRIQMKSGQLYINGRRAAQADGEYTAEGDGPQDAAQALYRDAAGRPRAPDPEGSRRRAARQHPGIQGARRLRVRDGRQPRQQPGQPGA